MELSFSLACTKQIGDKLRKFGVVTLDSGDFEEDLEIVGIGVINGNLKAFTIKTTGMTVGGTLESTKGSILTTAKKNNFLQVKKNLISANEIRVNGKCEVGGTIQAQHLEVVGSLKAEAVEAHTVSTKGKVEINQEIRATKAITLVVNISQKINVIGQIKAPLVTLKFRSKYPKYTKIGNLPRNVFRAFGMMNHFKKDYFIDNFRIKADILRLDSLYSIDNVEYTFSDNCELEVQKVEKVQGE